MREKPRMARFGWKKQVRGKIMLSVPDIHCAGKQSIQDSRK